MLDPVCSWAHHTIWSSRSVACFVHDELRKESAWMLQPRIDDVMVPNWEVLCCVDFGTCIVLEFQITLHGKRQLVFCFSDGHHLGTEIALLVGQKRCYIRLEDATECFFFLTQFHWCFEMNWNSKSWFWFVLVCFDLQCLFWFFKFAIGPTMTWGGCLICVRCLKQMQIKQLLLLGDFSTRWSQFEPPKLSKRCFVKKPSYC